jgi:hypothetical protein
MNRITLREASRQYANARQSNPAAKAGVRLVAINNDKKLRFHAQMTIATVESVVAGDNGKVKVFGNVDDFLKFFAKAAESGDGVYDVEVDTGMILASGIPSNMLTWAQNQVTKLSNVKIAQQKAVTAIDVQLGMMLGWDNGNQAQVAKFLDVTEQKACVLADIAAITTEIARLNSLIGTP